MQKALQKCRIQEKNISIFIDDGRGWEQEDIERHIPIMSPNAGLRLVKIETRISTGYGSTETVVSWCRFATVGDTKSYSCIG